MWSHSPPVRLCPEVEQKEEPSLLSTVFPAGPGNEWSLWGAHTKFRAAVRKNSENGFSEHSGAQKRTGWQSRRQERGFHTPRLGVGCEFHQASSNHGAGHVSARRPK